MTISCFYVEPLTKNNILINDMPLSLPNTIIKLNKSIKEIMIDHVEYSLSELAIYKRTRWFDDVFHSIIKCLSNNNVNIYIGLQKSNNGMRFTGYYSIDDKITDVSIHTSVIDDIIYEINKIKNDTSEMINILERFFGMLYISNYGFSAIFENIKNIC